MDPVAGDSRPKRCTVLGGRGFVGRFLVARLLRLGGWIVRVADSAKYPRLDDDVESDSILKDALASGCASYHCVDVRDKSQIVKAIEDSYVVFYMGPDGLPAHDYCHCYKVIVQGARNVISACLESKVRQLIYNSTADVVFNGLQVIRDGDETLRCPRKFQSVVMDFKTQAEALIRYANNSDRLLTCALRPSIVFGPGDPEFVPFLVALSKFRCGKFITGNKETMSDFTYVENVAHAHICAAEALDARKEIVAGKEFFITNLKPVRFWDFVSNILEGLGYSRPAIKLPVHVVGCLLSLLSWTQEKLGVRKGAFSYTAQYVFQLASCTRTFNCTAAEKLIGYSPVVSLEDGIALTLNSFSHLAKDSYLERYGNSSNQSKAYKFLGGEKVADILLWRDEKKSFGSFFILNALLYWFSFTERTLTSSVAKLLLLLAVILYGYSFMPPNILSIKVKRITSSTFEIPKSAVRDIFKAMSSSWNISIRNIKSMSESGDLNKFIKVVICLYLLKLMASQSLATMVFIVLAFSFTGFYIYEQNEVELHLLARLIINCVMSLKRVLSDSLPASVATFLTTHGTESPLQRKSI